MISIYISNTRGKIDGDLTIKKDIIKYFAIRAKGAFFATAFRQRSWDGFVKHVSEAGYFGIGLLPEIIEHCKNKNYKTHIIDNRDFIHLTSIQNKVGDNKLRAYQDTGLFKFINNRVLDQPFHCGIFDHATNAGKTMLAAGLFLSLPESETLIFIVSRLHLYQQALKEIPGLIGESVGYVGPDGIKWDRFMICTKDSLIAKWDKVVGRLRKIRVCIVDECHYSTSKGYKKILQALQDCTMRVGLSGTPQKHKDKNKNRQIVSFFGPVIDTVTNKQLVDQGHSTPPVIRIWLGNTDISIPGDYNEELQLGIINNKTRNNKVVNLVGSHYNKGRYPILVICKFISHTEKIYKLIKAAYPELKIDFIHVKVPDRFKKLEKFKKGKLDVLVSSQLIKDGLNLPLIKALINASAGDSEIVVLQIFGRLLRTDKSKSVVYIDDFWDNGSYLKRHSKHRIKYYKDQNFLVKEKHLLQLKKWKG